MKKLPPANGWQGFIFFNCQFGFNRFARAELKYYKTMYHIVIIGPFYIMF